jgi:hypothetical protein
VTPGQGQGYLAAGLGHDALKGGARNAHVPGCFFLGQIFEIGQAQGFQLLLEEGDTAQPVQWHTGRFVDRRPGRTV